MIVPAMILALTLTPGCQCESTCERQIQTLLEETGGGEVYTTRLDYCLQKEEELFWSNILSAPGAFGLRPASVGGDAGETPRVIGRVGLPGFPTAQPRVRALEEDADGRLLVGGMFSAVEDGLGARTEARGIVRFDAEATGGVGAWTPLGGGLLGQVNAIVRAPDGAILAGGSFPQAVGDPAPLQRLARWTASTDRWEPLPGWTSLASVGHLAWDAAGRLVVGSGTAEAVNPDGTSIQIFGVSRVDLQTETWEAIGPGFVSPVFTGLWTGPGEEVVVTGSTLLPRQPACGGASCVGPVMRWDGTQWDRWDEGITEAGDPVAGESRVHGLAADASGTLYVRYTRLSPTAPTVMRIARRSPGDATWTTVAEAPDIASVVASTEADGAVFSGTFTEIAGQAVNGTARWVPGLGRGGGSVAPVPTPGACRDGQVLHAIADPGGLPVDLVVGDTRLADDLAYGSATARYRFDPGEPREAHLVLGGSAPLRWARRTLSGATSDTLYTLREFVFEDRACVSAAVGVLDPGSFAPNPDGRFIGPAMATADLPDPDARGGRVAVPVLHAVTDAPRLGVVVDGTRVIDGLGYGRIDGSLLLDPGVHSVRLVRADDGTEVTAFDLDLTGAADQRRTLAVTGFLDPEANQNGPSLQVAVVNEAGQSTPVATASETPPSADPPDARLLGHRPNPVRETASISFVLTRPQSVRLVLYDLRGRRLRTLASGPHTAGTHTVALSTEGLAAGLYVYALDTRDGLQTRRLVLAH